MNEKTSINDSDIMLPPQKLNELEQKFSYLDDIMERVATINGVSSGDLQLAIDELNAFGNSIFRWDFKQLPDNLLNPCLNHLTYHREILANLIYETRLSIEEERRELFKRIVAYSKRYGEWLKNLEPVFSARISDYPAT